MENRTEDRNIVSAEDAEQHIDAVEVTKNEETEPLCIYGHASDRKCGCG